MQDVSNLGTDPTSDQNHDHDHDQQLHTVISTPTSNPVYDWLLAGNIQAAIDSYQAIPEHESRIITLINLCLAVACVPTVEGLQPDEEPATVITGLQDQLVSNEYALQHQQQTYQMANKKFRVQFESLWFRLSSIEGTAGLTKDIEMLLPWLVCMARYVLK